jgi:hypothetical protein
MDFIPVSNDLLFKKTFASPENADILGGLVSDCYGRAPKSIIIKKPYSIQEFIRLREETTQNILRLTERDVRAVMDFGDLICEMQLRPFQYFDRRIVYYMCSNYCENYDGDYEEAMAKGKNLYATLRPVYSINLLGYRHFKDERAFRAFELYDVEGQEKYPGEPLKVCFFEYNKREVKTENLMHWQHFFNTNQASANAPDYIRKAASVVDFVVGDPSNACV